MSLLPLMTNSAPGQPLFAAAGAGGGGGGVPADLVVSTLVVAETIAGNGQTTIYPASQATDPLTFVQVSGDLATTNYNVNLDMRTLDDGKCLLSQGVAPAIAQPLGCLTQLYTNINGGQLLFSGPSTNTEGGQSLAPRYLMACNMVGSTFAVADLYNAAGMGIDSVGNVSIEGTNLFLNGAIPAGRVQQSIFTGWDGTVSLGPGEVKAMTIGFSTTIGNEYRLAWSDSATVISGTPAANDTLSYLVDNGVYLDQIALTEVDALAKDRGSGVTGPRLGHNLTFVATATGHVFGMANDTATCSTTVTLTQPQIRLQDLGPVVAYAGLDRPRTLPI